MIAGQFFLAANTLTEVYRAADIGANELWVETFVCNQDGGQWSTLDIAVTRGTEVPEAKHYMYRGYSLRPNETKHPRLLLKDGDVLSVRATTARVSVTVSAEEIVTPRVLSATQDSTNTVLHNVIDHLETAEIYLEATHDMQQTFLGERDNSRPSSGVFSYTRSSFRLVRHRLFENVLINGTGNSESTVVDLEYVDRIESLLLRAASVSGAADVKAEYRTSWDSTLWDSYDDNADITSSTATDKTNNPEGMNAYTMAASLNKHIQIRVTGVAANPTDTRVDGWLVVREGFAS